MSQSYYISITGLNVKSFWHMPKFLRYTTEAKRQAEAAPGNISASTHGPYNGIYHTMTVWKDRSSMLRYFVSGAHAKAMKITSEISRPEGTKVYGYSSDHIPTWDEAYALWDKHGVRHGKPVPSVGKRYFTTFESSVVIVTFGATAIAAGLYYLASSSLATGAAAM